MKTKLLLISLIISLTALAQSEEFRVLQYSFNGIEMPKTEIQSGHWFTKFTSYNNHRFFILGNSRDSTFSYGILEKNKEYEIEPQDSANLVIYNTYTWYYANSYNKKEGIAEIVSYRIFYTEKMLIQISIKIEEIGIKDKILITAYNRNY